MMSSFVFQTIEFVSFSMLIDPIKVHFDSAPVCVSSTADETVALLVIQSGPRRRGSKGHDAAAGVP